MNVRNQWTNNRFFSHLDLYLDLIVGSEAVLSNYVYDRSDI